MKLLIYRMITEYAEWERYEECSNITLQKETLIAILQELDDNKLSNIGKSMGANLLEQLKKYSLSDGIKNYLQYVSMICKYAHFASYEISVNRNNYTLMLTHQLGQKWTIFLKNWIEEGLKTSAIMSANFETDANKVIARFTI